MHGILEWAFHSKKWRGGPDDGAGSTTILQDIQKASWLQEGWMKRVKILVELCWIVWKLEFKDSQLRTCLAEVSKDPIQNGLNDKREFILSHNQRYRKRQLQELICSVVQHHHRSRFFLPAAAHLSSACFWPSHSYKMLHATTLSLWSAHIKASHRKGTLFLGSIQKPSPEIPLLF